MTVQFGDVEIPRELINAHEAGELVIFVGAGASMGPPSNLPSFSGLTEIIRDETQLKDVVGDLRNQPLDEIMGDIEEKYDVDVHLRAAVHTGKKSSLPNALHHAVADLARCSEVRVVTTNYDRHLSTALGADVTNYVSPALPMGSEFSGLVYLHGCLTQHPKHLVVTARDFGRAYLTEAWAARFLERMFATYTTLFIGYSHNDVIMKYLARGLGPQAKQRYICTHESDSGMWKQLNIIPVGYSGANSHRALTLAVKGWAIRASSGLLDHQRQVASIMDSRQPGDLSPEESSYLQSVVSDENAVQFFCERADGLDWLRWVSDQSEFRALFDPVRLGSAISWRLAAWFAKNYITDELSGDALAAVRSFGGRLSPQLWDALARRLLSLQETGGFTVGIRPWLLLLTRTAPDQSVIFLDMLLSHCGLPAEMEPAALLFSYLTQPQVVDAPSVFGGLRSEVRLRGDRHRLHDMWNDVFKPSLEFAATVLLPIIDHHLRSAQRDINLSYEFGSGEILGSPVHPVATSSGESYSDPSEFLVEAARDCVEALLRHDVSRAESQLTAWASSDVALLRRLAIHGWTVRSDVDASTMANWLGNQGLILDYDYQAETAPFIARILESNDTEAIDDVIADILAHANDDRFTPRRALRTLNWMRRAGLAIDEIDNAIAALIDQHNDLEPLVQAAESVSSEPPPLTAADELKLLLDENDIQGAVSLLQQYATQDERADVFTWDRIENTLAGAVRESPALGFSLLDRVDHSSDVGMAVVGPVIRGWSTAVVADELAQRILSRIASLDISRSAGDVAAMLAGVREAASQGTEWTKFATSRDLAKACWAAIGTEPAEEKDDWFHTALNSPAGQLAIYWLHVADDEHSRAAGGWQGLPPDLSTELAAMLTCGDGRGELVEVVFGRDVSFLHSIDPNWCEEHVVRLFDWADEPRALRVWSGYLSGGRFNDDLLRAGLLDVALQAVIRAQLFRKQLRHSLFGMLAQTAIRSMLDPREWVPTLVRNAGIEDRVLWADEVTDYLGRIEPDEVEVQWGRWMRSYWEGRLESVPRRMNTQEASSMAQWVVYLSESVGEGVGLVVQCPAAFTQYSRLLHELSEQRVQNDPSAFAQLVSHLLCGTELPFYGYEVSDVLRHLRSHGIAEQQLNTIKEQALRLGITLDDR